MPRTSTPSPKQAAPALLPVLLAGLLLAGCGGSSSSTSTSANAAASASATGPAGSRTGRFAQLRECLQKNGITLPKPTPGTQRAPGSGGFFGGGAGRQLPAGVTRAQYDALLGPTGALIVGDPETVAEKILRMNESLGGISRLTFQMSVAALPHAKLMRAIELLGTRVAPLVRTAFPPSTREALLAANADRIA